MGELEKVWTRGVRDHSRVLRSKVESKRLKLYGFKSAKSESPLTWEAGGYFDGVVGKPDLHKLHLLERNGALSRE